MGLQIVNNMVTTQLDGIRKRNLEVLVLIHLPENNNLALVSVPADDAVADLHPVVPFDPERKEGELPENVAQVALVSFVGTEQEAEQIRTEQERKYKIL